MGIVARSFDGATSEASCTVLVRETAGASPAEEGIPEPELVETPGPSWHSRLFGKRWQVNSAHPECRAIRDRPQPKVRYLAMLLAKGVVLRSSNDPRLEAPLEQLVEIAAYADRNLGRKGRGRHDADCASLFVQALGMPRCGRRAGRLAAVPSRWVEVGRGPASARG